MKKFLVLFVFTLSSLASSAAVLGELISNEKIQEGDLIFIESQTQQAAAIKEGTDSPWSHVGMLFRYRPETKLANSASRQGIKEGDWVVVESAGPVGITALDSFVQRSRGLHYLIGRYPGNITTAQATSMWREFVDVQHGKAYDIYFRINGMYCSLLTYKLFQKIGLTVGQLEKTEKYLSSNPRSKVGKLMTQRDPGKKILRPQDPIVTPASQAKMLKVISQSL